MPAKGYALYRAQEGAASPRSWSMFDPIRTLTEIFKRDTQPPPQDPALDDPLANLLNLFANESVSQSGASSSWSATPVLPPVIELLAEMRNRRDSEAARAKLISDILFSNVPAGQEFYPGYEPGGVADVLLGIITGKGPSAAAGILPEAQRRVRRQQVPIPGLEPSAGEEFGEANALAQAIMNAIRVISTGGSQSQTSAVPSTAAGPTISGPTFEGGGPSISEPTFEGGGR